MKRFWLRQPISNNPDWRRGFISIYDLFGQLKQVSDTQWGMYAFSRDNLRDKISDRRKLELTEQAIGCGRFKAEECLNLAGIKVRDFQTSGQLAEYLKLKPGTEYGGQTGTRILFASFTPPDEIRIMQEPLELAFASGKLKQILSPDEVSALLLGHEIFHYIEEQDPAIFTRREKQLLNHCFGIKRHARIGAISEIAAMYFSQTLSGYPYSPFILDILLTYYYNPSDAVHMLEEALAY